MDRCCSGKAISIIYLCGRVRVRKRPGMLDCACACVRVAFTYPACNSYALCCDVIYGLSGPTIFFDIISQKVRFSEKKSY
jgi:hypothetical protein